MSQLLPVLPVLPVSRQKAFGLAAFALILAGLGLYFVVKPKTSRRDLDVAEQAIVEKSSERGFRLSDPAQKRLGIRTRVIESEGEFQASPEALVHYGDQVGVYLLRGGWFKLVQVKWTKEASGLVVVRSPELRQGDALVIGGAPFLRVTDLAIEEE